MPFCKLAYKDLVENQDSLVFQKIELEREIGEKEVEIALKVGIISERKAFSTVCNQYVKVHFIHKSIQELLAAIYILQGEGRIFKSFLIECNSFFKIMAFSGVITSICGLDVKSGKTVLEHIMKLAETDDHVRSYRKMPHDYVDYVKHGFKILDPSQNAFADSHQLYMNIEYPFQKVSFLFQMQCIWHKELEYKNMDSDTKQERIFYVKHIYLDKNSDDNAVEMAREIMMQSWRKVISVKLDGEMVVDERMIKALTNCVYTTFLQISCIPDSSAHSMFFEALNRLKRLQYVRFYGSSEYSTRNCDNSTFILSLCRETNLTRRNCFDVIAKLKSTGRSNIKNLFFENVFMSSDNWKRFRESLFNVKEKVYIGLKNTNIDPTSVSLITSFSNNTVLCNNGVDNNGNSKFILFLVVPYRTVESINLLNTSLLENEIFISQTTTSLCSVRLTSVTMPASGWKSLVDSFSSVNNMICVEANYTNIDIESVSRIVESSSFTVISNSQRSEDGGYKCLCFYTKPTSKLKCISLCKSMFGDSGLTVSEDMVRLREIRLTSVQMSSKGWCKFIDSIRVEKYLSLCVTLKNTNIDEESIMLISSCPNIMFRYKANGEIPKTIRFYKKPVSEIEIIEICDRKYVDYGLTISEDMTRLRVIMLQSVQMSRKFWRQFINSICIIENLCLSIELNNTNIDNASVDLMLSCSNFESILLKNCTFGDSGITISDHMRRLKEISLTSVHMSRKGWRTFVQNIRSIEHGQFRITLEKTNIDKGSVALISTCGNIVKTSGIGYRDKIILFVRYLHTSKCLPSLCPVRDRKEAKEIVFLVAWLVVSIVVGIGVGIAVDSVVGHPNTNLAVGILCFLTISYAVGTVFGAFIGAMNQALDGISNGQRVSNIIRGIIYGGFVGSCLGLSICGLFALRGDLSDRPTIGVSQNKINISSGGPTIIEDSKNSDTNNMLSSLYSVSFASFACSCFVTTTLFTLGMIFVFISKRYYLDFHLDFPAISFISKVISPRPSR